MECKCAIKLKASSEDIRINRYIMECKSGKRRRRIMYPVQELIDTLWNVNWIRQSPFPQSLRINIYIMECKLASWKKWLKNMIEKYGELIDTLWNVNITI